MPSVRKPEVRRRSLTSVGLLVGLTLALVSCGSGGSAGPGIAVSSPAAASSFAGATFDPAKRLPDVTLTDTAGRPWNLQARGQGRITVLYFGYTNCPDACPTDMAEMATALRQLPPPVRNQVQVVFVTVDLRRDTRAAIRHWLDRFDAGLPAFVGLRGTPRQTTAAAHGLGLQFQVSTTTAGLEAVEHSSQLTAFDQTGTSHLVWLDPTAPRDIAHDLRLLAAGVKPA